MTWRTSASMGHPRNPSGSAIMAEIIELVFDLAFLKETINRSHKEHLALPPASQVRPFTDRPAMLTGLALREVKRQLPFGSFIAWINAEVDFTYTEAGIYMRNAMRSRLPGGHVVRTRPCGRN